MPPLTRLARRSVPSPRSIRTRPLPHLEMRAQARGLSPASREAAQCRLRRSVGDRARLCCGPRGADRRRIPRSKAEGMTLGACSRGAARCRLGRSLEDRARLRRGPSRTDRRRITRCEREDMAFGPRPRKASRCRLGRSSRNRTEFLLQSRWIRPPPHRVLQLPRRWPGGDPGSGDRRSLAATPWPSLEISRELRRNRPRLHLQTPSSGREP